MLSWFDGDNLERDNNVENEYLDDTDEENNLIQKSSPACQTIEKPNSASPKGLSKSVPSCAKVVGKCLKEATDVEGHNPILDKVKEDVEFLGFSRQEIHLQDDASYDEQLNESGSMVSPNLLGQLK
ncbi:hypothetical protein V6N13_040035 [Hibiscus sabdariffa]